MQQFVGSHSRHGDLAEALGFRLGAGRGKTLFQLRHGAMTLSELAEANKVDAPYATLIVDKLEGHGLVERRPHPEDRRRKLVALTTEGRRAIDAADRIIRRPPRAMASLGTEDLLQLSQLLGRLIEADEADDPRPKP